MATYVPNASDTTEPTSSQSVESAALEFRTLKLRVNTLETAVNTEDAKDLRVPEASIAPIPSVSTRAGKVLGFDAGGDPVAIIVTGDEDPGLRVDLSASSGASLVGANAYQTQDDVNGEIPSVKGFGAVGDGVTNDTPAFQAAEAAHDFIYLPAGDYLVSYAPTKTFSGPGNIITNGVSAVTFSGAGVNDASVTGTYSGAFPLQILARITNPATAAVATTGFSAAGGIGTLTCAGGATYPVHSWVEISGASVTSGSINGKQMVLTSSAGQITFYTAATGAQTVAGTVQDFDEFELSFNAGATYLSTYQTYDPFTDNDKAVRYTVNTWASPITITGTGSRVFGFSGLNISWATPRGHTAGASWAFTLTPPAEKLFTQGNSIYLNGAKAITMESNRSIGIGPNVFGNLNSMGVENIGIGINALKNNTTGYQNIGISSDTLTTNESGGANIAIGGSALHDNVTGSDNIAIGLYSQYRTTGYNNVSVGVDSLRQNYAGNENVAVGTQAMYSVENGLKNVAVGLCALRGGNSTFPTGITNNYCTAIGALSQNLTSNASHNTSVGFESLYQSDGPNNTALGSEAGFRNVSGSDNIFIGYNAGGNVLQKSNGLYQIAIGSGAYTTADYAIAIGQGVSAGAGEIVVGGPGYSTVRNGADNNAACGGASYRWSVVYSATGAINTSDVREKQDQAALSAAERNVAIALKGLIKTFRFKDAVAEKGAAARIHVGVMAQEVISAFQAEGLDATRYAMLCYDEWVATDTMPAGNRYGIRYDELLAFVIGAL